jgi:hypothetical protein
MPCRNITHKLCFTAILGVCVLFFNFFAHAAAYSCSELEPASSAAASCHPVEDAVPQDACACDDDCSMHSDDAGLPDATAQASHTLHQQMHALCTLVQQRSIPLRQVYAPRFLRPPLYAYSVNSTIVLII